MTYTDAEIEIALGWSHSGYAFRIPNRDVLSNAARRTQAYGSYHMIAEHILRTTLNELRALAKVQVTDARFIRLCGRYGVDEVDRILVETEEKAESYRDKTRSLHVAHAAEFDGG